MVVPKRKNGEKIQVNVKGLRKYHYQRLHPLSEKKIKGLIR